MRSRLATYTSIAIGLLFFAIAANVYIGLKQFEAGFAAALMLP